MKKRLICLLIVISTIFTLTSCFRSEKKYDYEDMSKYIILPDYKSQVYEIDMNEIQRAIDSYIMQYSSEYTVQRGNRVNVDIKFFEVTVSSGDDGIFELRGNEITDLSKSNYWIDNVATPIDGSSYQISSKIENMIIGAKLSSTIPEQKFTLNDDFFNESSFFDEKYRGKDVFVEVIVNNVSCEPGFVVSTSYTGYYIDENGSIIQEDGKDKTFDSNDSAPFYIGSHLAIDDVENGMVGMSIGETKDIIATFPEDYFEEDFAGKKVMFRLKMNSVYRPQPYNDTFIKTYFPAFKNTADFEEGLKEKYVLSKIYEYINKNVKILEYPKSEYRAAEEQLELITAPFAEQKEISLDEYIKKVYGMSREEFIKSNMTTEMIFYSLRNQLKNVEPTESELIAERNLCIAQYKSDYMSQGMSETAALNAATDFVDELGESYVYEIALFNKIDEALPHLVSTTTKEKTYTSISEAQVK